MPVYEILPHEQPNYRKKKKRKNPLNLFSVNTIIIFINVILFIIFSILLRLNLLTLDYIAIQPANIFQGMYLWTFITSMFMHAGFFHLFVNMLSLFFVGSLIEKIIGRRRYISFYLIAGIISSLLFVLASLLIPADFNAYAVGASGALFGLIGLMMLLTPNLKVYIMFIPIPIKLKYAAPGMLIALWAISIAGNIPIGNIAHLGGLLTGLVYGVYLRKKYKKKIQLISKRFS
jgi:membrane associated rhomboid family serine protease